MSQRTITYYAVTQKRGESWDTKLPMRQQEKWDEHSAFMDALVDDGFVILGGPLDDEELALLIIAAQSEEEIVARLAGDPWASLGLRPIAKIERWQILLGDIPRNK